MSDVPLRVTSRVYLVGLVLASMAPTQWSVYPTMLSTPRVLGDGNGDGISDLVAVRFAGGTYHLALYSTATGDELAAYRTSAPIRDYRRIGDVDRDGTPDLAVIEIVAATASLRIVSARTGTSLRHVPLPVGVLAIRERALCNAGDLNQDGVEDFACGVRLGSMAPGTGDAVMVFDPVTGNLLATLGAPYLAQREIVRIDRVPDIDRDQVSDLVVFSRGAGGLHVHAFSTISLGSLWVNTSTLFTNIEGAGYAEETSFAFDRNGDGRLEIACCLSEPFGPSTATVFLDLATGVEQVRTQTRIFGPVGNYDGVPGEDWLGSATLNPLTPRVYSGATLLPLTATIPADAVVHDLDGDGVRELFTASISFCPGFQDPRSAIWQLANPLQMCKHPIATSPSQIRIRGGMALANLPYVVLGSASGWHPGISMPGFPHVPLNVFVGAGLDPYFSITSTLPNVAFGLGGFGILNTAGNSDLTLSPAVAALLHGFLLHHSLVVFSGDFMRMIHASGPVAMRFR